MFRDFLFSEKVIASIRNHCHERFLFFTLPKESD